MTGRKAWNLVIKRIHKQPRLIPIEQACKTCLGAGFEMGMSPDDGSDCLWLDENNQAIPCQDCGGTGYNRKTKLEKLLS